MTSVQKQQRSDDVANERPISNYKKTPVSQEQLQRETGLYKGTATTRIPA